MRRFAALGVVIGLLFAISVPAMAGQVQKEMTKFSDSFEEVIPAGAFCDFPVGVSEQVKGIDTVWLNSETYAEIEQVADKLGITLYDLIYNREVSPYAFFDNALLDDWVETNIRYLFWERWWPDIKEYAELDTDEKQSFIWNNWERERAFNGAVERLTEAHDDGE